MRLRKQKSTLNTLIAKLLIVSSAALFTPSISMANPQGGVVAGGTVSITNPSPTHTQIDQSSTRGIIDWRSFNINANTETLHYINELSLHSKKKIITVNAGSALKFGLIAENKADIYPRLSPTMEWDTAAGHILVNEVGKRVCQYQSDDEIIYNKKCLINPSFIVS